MKDACILTLNSGSATLKYAVFGPTRLSTPGDCLMQGQVDLPAGSHGEAVRDGLCEIERRIAAFRVAAVGHRIVHGGTKFAGPAIIDDAVVAELVALQPLAPLHQRLGLAVVEAARSQRPDVPHVAAFDTAFHASMPIVAQRFALPQLWFDRGVRRFGFHGLSYEFIASKLAQMRETEPMRRVVVAHLGSGASLCAMRDGRSVATTMSFTPTDGLMMATRSGALDPAVVLYLLREDTDERRCRRASVEPGIGIARRIRLERRHAHVTCEQRPGGAARRASCSCIASWSKSVRWSRRSAESMRSCSPAASAHTRRRSGQRVCEALAWLGVDCDRIAQRKRADAVR